MNTSMQKPDAGGRSIFSRFAVPYTFSPDLGLGDALVAIAGTLFRIFAGCLLFAVWGGFSGLAWSTIANRFWRVAALLPMFVLFLAALGAMLIGVAAAE